MKAALSESARDRDGFMISRKYLSDYRLEHIEGKNGRMKSKAVYIGDYFEFSMEQPLFRKTRLELLVSTAVLAGAFVFGLFMNAASAHTMYVIGPDACVMLPLAFQIYSVYELFTVRTPMRRETAEKIKKRTVTSTVFCAVFASVALAGDAVFFAVQRDSLRMPGDVLFAVSLIVQVVFSWLSFRARGAAFFRQTEKSHDKAGKES